MGCNGGFQPAPEPPKPVLSEGMAALRPGKLLLAVRRGPWLLPGKCGKIATGRCGWVGECFFGTHDVSEKKDT